MKIMKKNENFENLQKIQKKIKNRPENSPQNDLKNEKVTSKMKISEKNENF